MQEKSFAGSHAAQSDAVKWSRLTVNLDPQLAALAKRRAAEQRRSFAAYVATLIEQDTREYPEQAQESAHVAEDRAVQELLTPRHPAPPSAVTPPPRPRPAPAREKSPRPAKAKH